MSLIINKSMCPPVANSEERGSRATYSYHTWIALDDYESDGCNSWQFMAKSVDRVPSPAISPANARLDYVKDGHLKLHDDISFSGARLPPGSLAQRSYEYLHQPQKSRADPADLSVRRLDC